MFYFFQVKSVLDEIMEKLPEPFNMAEIMAKAEDKTPYVVVAFQECERMNILTHEIRRSLKELDLGLKVGTAESTFPCPTLSCDLQIAAACFRAHLVQSTLLPAFAFTPAPCFVQGLEVNTAISLASSSSNCPSSCLF